ncbi:MAG: hypothetical protein IKF83_01840 [Clostridia bacterium]|nr:hypothetical protein [Clostridia bacterium]
MEKTKLIKGFLIIIVAFALVFNVSTVFAADNNTIDFVDVTNRSSSDSNTNGNNTNTNSNSNNTNTNSNTNRNTNSNNTNSISNTSNTNNSNSSSYNTNKNKNTNLPKTGIAETGSIVCVVFALAVSAVYAFKKLRDYNI